MSDINARQLSADGQRRLRAYTSEYRMAKRYSGTRRIVDLLFAAAGPLVAIVGSDTLTGAVGVAASLWVLITRVGLVRFERKHVAEGVRLQEHFDTFVFNLPWPTALAGTPVLEDDVTEAKQRVEADADLTAAIAEGWYHPTPTVPWPADVLLAQISSTAWSRRQHRTYVKVLWAAIALGIVTAVVAGLVLDMTFAAWLITFLLPGMPALLDGVELAEAHANVGKDRRDLELRICEAWSKVERDGAKGVTAAECRAFQDDSYRLRAKGVQVPEWLYWKGRAHHERIMRDATEARVRRFEEGAHAPPPSQGAAASAAP